MRNKKTSVPSQFILTILTIVCVILLFAGYSLDFHGGLFTTVADILFVPMQRGISIAAGQISNTSSRFQEREELLAENERLNEEVEALRIQLSEAQQDAAELERLRELMALGDSLSDYETTSARVIAGSTGSWFSTFIIDKGSEDGVTVDMNVMAPDGLAGIVIRTGAHFSTVRSIIDDDARVSAMVAGTGDHCIVSGSLKDMTQDQLIRFSSLEDPDGKLQSGDALVTSYISDKYLPGLLIGYVVDITPDANNLTTSGTVVPVVDFRHLREVLVILQCKETEDPE